MNYNYLNPNVRSSHPVVFCKNGFLKNFSKLTEEHLYQSLFLNKVVGLRNFIKKEALAQAFSYEFCEIFKNTFFIEHLQWLSISLLGKV